MSSKEVFELRNEGRLSEAYEMAQALYREDPHDEWVQRAFAWTLVDLCKKAIEEGNFTQASVYFDQFISIENVSSDDLLNKQIKILRPRIDQLYGEVKEAEERSKNGDHNAALQFFYSKYNQNQLPEIHHESFGWAIYRYIKGLDKRKLSEIKKRLADYLKLKNERPSLLHSVILSHCLFLIKDTDEFNLKNFIIRWDITKFRSEDRQDDYKDGKTYPSLISKIIRVFVAKNYFPNANQIIDFFTPYIETGVDEDPFGFSTDLKGLLLDYMREPFFWKVYDLYKLNKTSDQWNVLDEYVTFFENTPGSSWHSKVLSIAENSVKEGDENRLLVFFKAWNPKNLLSKDWQEEKKGETIYKPLAIKVLKTVFDSALKSNTELDWIKEIVDKAVESYPKDIWIYRLRAQYYLKNEEYGEASAHYKILLQELKDQPYIWGEAAKCYINSNLAKAISLYAQAIKIQGNEDFLGEIRISLASLLVETSNFEGANIQLAKYREHRIIKGWRLAQEFENYSKQEWYEEVDSETNTEINFIDEESKKAQSIAYEDLEWKEVIIADIWKTKDNKTRVSVFSETTGVLSLNPKKFDNLKTYQKGDIVEIKLYDSKFDEKEVTVALRKTSGKTFEDYLPKTVAFVEYHNKEKGVHHLITKDDDEVFVRTNIGLGEGDFVSGYFLKYGPKKSKRIPYSFEIKDHKEEAERCDLLGIVKISHEDATKHFQSYLGIIDNKNTKKELYHFVVDSTVQGIFHFKNFGDSFNEGDFVQLSLIKKYDKKRNRLKFIPLNIQSTEEKSTELLKHIEGHLELKYKDSNIGTDPDFGFIRAGFADYYVPKYLLKDRQEDEDVEATVIFCGDKWRTLRID